MALIQTNKASFTGIGATITISFPNPTTSGNFIVVGYSDNSGFNGANLNSITDGNNTFTNVAQNGTGIVFSALFFASGIIGATTHTLTLHIDPLAQGSSGSVIIREYSGVMKTSPNDVVAGNNGTNATPDSGATGIVSQAEMLVIGYANANANNLTWSPASGWGNIVVENSGVDPLSSAMEDTMITAIGTTRATFSLSSAPPNNWSCLCATFKLSHLGITVTNISYRFIDRVIGY